MKQCPSCRLANHDEVRFCMGCGTPLPDIMPAAIDYAAAQQFGNQPAFDNKQVKRDNQGRVGIGGWLLFYLIMLVSSLTGKCQSLSDSNGFFYALIVIIYVIVGGFVIYCIISRNNAVYYGLYALLALEILLFFLSSFDPIYPGLILFDCLWILYFHQSARVKATFPPRA